MFEKNIPWRSHSCDVCKNPVYSICQNAVGEEGYGSKILCYLCAREEREFPNTKGTCSKYPYISCRKDERIVFYEIWRN